MKKILIIGATSAIAEATARIWAQRGDELFLVARNQERLAMITQDLRVRGSPRTYSYCMDVNNFEEHQPMLNEVFKVFETIDIALIAHGTLSNQKKCEYSVQLSIEEIQTNALSVIALLTHLTNHFEMKKSGTIAVISSIAGDRGKASNYVYGSAKAMVSVFTSGLRQRLYKSGITVLTIKPGFVDTPMTAGFKKGGLWSKPEIVAKKIVLAIEKKQDVIYTPTYWYMVMKLINAIPESIFKKINL